MTSTHLPDPKCVIKQMLLSILPGRCRVDVHLPAKQITHITMLFQYFSGRCEVLVKHPMFQNTHITMLFQYFLGASREPRGVSRRSTRLSTSLQDAPQASKGFHERSMTLHEVHTEPHKAPGASRRLVEVC